MTTFNFGLLGVGRWGERYISTINELAGIQIRQLYTSKPDRARLVGNPVEVFADWREVIHSSGSDAIIVATPPQTHGAILRECLAANKPALVEKPLCLTADEAMALHVAAERRGTPVLVGHTQLFNAAYDALRDRAGARRDIRFIVSRGAGFGPFREDTPPLWDWCPHDFAFCLDLLEDTPADIEALGASATPDRRSRPEMLALRLDFRSGTVAWILAGCLSTERTRSLSVFFSDSVLFLREDEMGSSLLSYDVPVDERDQLPATFRLPDGNPVAVSPEKPLTREVKYFVQGLRGGDTGRFGTQLAVDVVRTLEQAQQALTKRLAS